MNADHPLINFNGAILVDSLAAGFIQIQNRRFPAVRIMLNQTLTYPLLAYGTQGAEIYAYCVESRRMSKKQLELYAQCYLVPDRRSGTQLPVVSRLTWYVSQEFREQCAEQVESILGGDTPGDEVYPVFTGDPLAVFKSD